MSLGLAGCAKDAANVNKGGLGTDKLSIRISNPSLRSIEDPATTGNITVSGTNAWIFIANATGNIVKEVALDYSTASSTGQTITGIPEDAASVFIVANVTKPADVTTLSKIKEAVYNVADYANYKTTPLANATGEAGLIDPPATTGDPATVSVQLSPVISRIELTKVRATANGTDTTDPGYIKITGFNVTGVYLNGYYKKFMLTSAASGDVIDGTDLALGDAGTWTAAADAVVSTDFSAVAAAGKVWAHNVVAQGTPRLIIRIEGVTATDGSGAPITNILDASTPDDLTDEVALAGQTFYLSMHASNPYNEVSGNFERGKVYQINELVFSADNLFTVPQLEDLDLLINVSIKDWVLAPITGNLNGV